MVGRAVTLTSVTLEVPGDWAAGLRGSARTWASWPDYTGSP